MSVISFEHLEIVIFNGKQTMLIKVKDGHIINLEPLDGVQNGIWVDKPFGVKSEVYEVIINTVVKVVCKDVGQVSYARLVDKIIVEFPPDSINSRMKNIYAQIAEKGSLLLLSDKFYLNVVPLMQLLIVMLFMVAKLA
jgi:hypothetical protein